MEMSQSDQRSETSNVVTASLSTWLMPNVKNRGRERTLY